MYVPLPILVDNVVAPVAGLSVTSLAFTDQVVGTASAAQAITVTNTGASNLVVSGVTMTGVDATQFLLSVKQLCDRHTEQFLHFHCAVRTRLDRR